MPIDINFPTVNPTPLPGLPQIYASGDPNNPRNVSTNPRISTTPSGVIRVTQGQTTLDKILQAALSSVALLRGAQYVPTEEVPAGLYASQFPQYPQGYYPQTQPISDGGTGATFGAGLESFIRNNTGLIAVGLVGYLLLMSGRK